MSWFIKMNFDELGYFYYTILIEFQIDKKVFDIVVILCNAMKAQKQTKAK